MSKGKQAGWEELGDWDTHIYTTGTNDDLPYNTRKST